MFIGYVLVPLTLTATFVPISLQLDYTRDAISNVILASTSVPALVALHFRPRWFPAIVNVVLGVATLSQIYTVYLFGGLIGSGLRGVFGVLVVIAALLLLGRRAAWTWFGIYVLQLIFGLVIAGQIEPTYEALDVEANIALNLVVMGAVVTAVTAYFRRERDRLQKESDDLLHNILPVDVAERLKSGDTPIADQYESASVLFADIVGFTPMSESMTPVEVIQMLTELFGVFDQMVEEAGLEKIRTVGDEYMVVAGVPTVTPDHAHALADLAIRMRDYSETQEFSNRKITFRIGINSGPLVAGVVGTKKLAYDLWGDVVNTASRMESQGVAGAIQISASTYRFIHKDFRCKPRGAISIKGKGNMDTYILLGRNPPVAK